MKTYQLFILSLVVDADGLELSEYTIKFIFQVL
jgi:hypothetical protein